MHGRGTTLKTIWHLGGRDREHEHSKPGQGKKVNMTSK
jgi:hypothetical protein